MQTGPMLTEMIKFVDNIFYNFITVFNMSKHEAQQEMIDPGNKNDMKMTKNPTSQEENCNVGNKKYTGWD